MDIETSLNQVYDALFQSVGDGLRGQPTSIVEGWRLARASGLAVATVDWRAALQAFPDQATDFISVYESLLGVQLDLSLTVQQKQQALEVQYTQSLDASGPSLLEQLQSIDPRFELADPGLSGADDATITDTGVRAFEDWNPASPQACGPAFDIAGRGYTLFPNYSSHFIMPIVFGISGAPTADEQRLMVSVGDQLNLSLPAWVDYRIFAALGFTLDQDHLDVTAFGG